MSEKKFSAVGIVVVGWVVLLLAIMVYIFWPSSAEAQSSSQSSSGSSASVETSSNANAGGGSANNQIYLDQRGADSGTFKNETRHSGDYTIRSAPAVQAPSMGSGHPCGLGGSIGLSIIGGGAAGGVTTVDEACLLAQMGQGEAALIMIAARDNEACKALRQVGRISSKSLCGDKPKQGTQAAKPTASPVQCVRVDGKIEARHRSNVDASDAVAYCTQWARNN